MKKSFLRNTTIYIKLLLICTLAFSFTKDNAAKKEEVLVGELFELLNMFHYTPQKIDDNFSEKAYNLYIQRLDYDKMFLTQNDLAILETYKRTIDDEIMNKTFNFFNLSIEIIDKKTSFIEAHYPEILSKPFDFNVDENYELDNDKRGYAQDDNQLLEYWRKSLKLETLNMLIDLVEDQDAAKAKSDTVKIKSFKELEELARTKIKKRIDDRFKRFEKSKRSDKFSNYMNSLIGVYDPHTNFFPPDDNEDFNIQLSGKLEGIGATLSEKDGYIKVESIVPGSASWKQGQLQPGDIILKVGQGDSEPVDIVDMRLDAAVRLIRGPKGTKVSLTVKKVDGSISKIAIIRDVVIIEETYAKSAVITNQKGNIKIGYIDLPSFYIDFKEKGGGRKCSDDILTEIKNLKAQNVNGIIIDLRGNGGGSLPDVVKIGGYFIENGPIVQVKSKDKPADVLNDYDKNTYFEGPLVIMVDEFSASASEILAAAMQDYKRAIIVGSNHSWGKGTVQQLADLDRFLSNAYDTLKPLGALKVTIQKFYRINGSTTQLQGVIPDITLPDKYKYIDLGEKEEDNPLKWDEITPAIYTKSTTNWDIDKIKKKSSTRVVKDTIFSKIEELAKYLKSQKDKTVFTLNYNEYKKQKDNDKEYAKKFNSLGKSETGLQIVTKTDIAATTKLDSLNIQKKEKWFDKLKKDPELYETFNIMLDMQ